MFLWGAVTADAKLRKEPLGGWHDGGRAGGPFSALCVSSRAGGGAHADNGLPHLPSIILRQREQTTKPPLSRPSDACEKGTRLVVAYLLWDVLNGVSTKIKRRVAKR